MLRMGLREANQHFAKAIKAVKAGQEVVLTERGKPIATIKPLTASENGDAAVRRLEVAGFLRPAQKKAPLPAWPPRLLKGPPLSHTLMEEREQS
ncbi:MAG: type II toxin-antitoxin system prevent-host-death family antitoxin [Nitrospirae bacterium]|nr:MAG: type II toxin-antitoxin system prevent-host-death family antitoxin [Nitrospirota bacterium]